MTVDATDADDPDTDNAALRYSILEQGAGGMFSINATTGQICTVRPGLDREVAGMGGTGGTGVTRGLGAARDAQVVKPQLQAMSRPRHGEMVGGQQLGDLWAPGGAGGAQHWTPFFPADRGGVQPDSAGSRHVRGWAYHHCHSRHLPGGHQRQPS